MKVAIVFFPSFLFMCTEHSFNFENVFILRFKIVFRPLREHKMNVLNDLFVTSVKNIKVNFIALQIQTLISLGSCEFSRCVFDRQTRRTRLKRSKRDKTENGLNSDISEIYNLAK